MENLNNIEIDKIENFMHDEVLVDAVKKILLATIYTNGTLRREIKPDPLKNGALSLAMLAASGRGVVSNADLGEDIRAIAQAITMMELGFNELSKVKKEKAEGEETPANPAI